MQLKNINLSCRIPSKEISKGLVYTCNTIPKIISSLTQNTLNFLFEDNTLWVKFKNSSYKLLRFFPTINDSKLKVTVFNNQLFETTGHTKLLKQSAYSPSQVTLFMMLL